MDPNAYAYVGNDPLTLTDPFGLCGSIPILDLINAIRGRCGGAEQVVILVTYTPWSSAFRGRWLPIRHRDFYDVPRLVVVEYQGDVYVFDSPFDDELDDYPDHYTVYRLPESEVTRLDATSWEDLASAGKEVGRVPVADVEFDATRRERLNASVFDRLGIR